MNTVKLVMLGEGGVGKTAISLRVAMNYFGTSGASSAESALS